MISNAYSEHQMLVDIKITYAFSSSSAAAAAAASPT